MNTINQQCYGEKLGFNPGNPNGSYTLPETSTPNSEWMYYDKDNNKWIALADEVKDNFTLPADENNTVTLVAVNKADVTYNLVQFEDENGNIIKTVNLKQGQALSDSDIPEAPLKEGYTLFVQHVC